MLLEGSYDASAEQLFPKDRNGRRAQRIASLIPYFAEVSTQEESLAGLRTTLEIAERYQNLQTVQLSEQQQKQLVRDLVDRAFGGSASQLVLHALATRKTSRRDLARIRELLDELEGGER